MEINCELHSGELEATDIHTDSAGRRQRTISVEFILSDLRVFIFILISVNGDINEPALCIALDTARAS